MCGIVRVLNLVEHPPAQGGPDGFGIYRDEQVALGNARLSIIDLAGGDQPIGNEDDSLWIVFNGEIFNYVELRPDPGSARAHLFDPQRVGWAS
jgi:asparagine synthase (glutamine-hydrolysing)